MINTTLTRCMTIAHGGYLLFGGLWPLIHLPSFETVTGAKEEDWLVRSVAGLLVVVSVPLLMQVRKEHLATPSIATAMGASLTLGLVGVIAASEDVVDPVYYADGAVHLLFVALWCVVLAYNAQRVKGKSALDVPPL